MTSEDGLRISVDPASMRVVENDALPPGTAVFVTPGGVISQLFPPTAKTRAFPLLADVKPVTFESRLDTTAFEEMLRTMGQAAGKVAQAFRSLRIGAWRPSTPRRPRPPRSGDATARRLYAVQLRVYRRALRRRRRQRPEPRTAPRFGNYERFMEIYAPNVVTRQRPDGSLEAQLLAYKPTD